MGRRYLLSAIDGDKKRSATEALLLIAADYETRRRTRVDANTMAETAALSLSKPFFAASALAAAEAASKLELVPADSPARVAGAPSSRPILNDCTQRRASVEWPMSSKYTVASVPFSLLMMANPPGCSSINCRGPKRESTRRERPKIRRSGEKTRCNIRAPMERKKQKEEEVRRERFRVIVAEKSSRVETRNGSGSNAHE